MMKKSNQEETLKKWIRYNFFSQKIFFFIASIKFFLQIRVTNETNEADTHEIHVFEKNFSIADEVLSLIIELQEQKK
jgi:hypothetical protein